MDLFLGAIVAIAKPPHELHYACQLGLDLFPGLNYELHNAARNSTTLVKSWRHTYNAASDKLDD
jgi:hypothetical protein